MPKPRTAATVRTLLADDAVKGVSRRRLRVATYRRASTDEENQPYSLTAQKTKLGAYITSQDDMEHVADYHEYASGKDIEGRPELLRLLEDAAAGKFDIVIVHKLDRWSRRLADLLATVEFLERHEVAFASATEPIDTTDMLGRLFLQILGSFAEYEHKVIVDRITRGIEAKVVTKGLPLGAVGFGLRKTSDGVVEADPKTFGVVERIFSDYTREKLGIKAIARALQEDGLPAPGARPWSGDAVARVLRNRTFIGELPYRDSWVPGAHDALLDPEVFEKAARIAAARTAPSVARRAAGDFVLSGTIICGHCGCAYVGNTGTSRNKTKVRYYACGTARRYGKASCAAPTLPADDLERLVGDALVRTYGDTDVFAGAIAEHLAQREASTGPLERELLAARSTVTTKDRLLTKYRDDYEADRLDADLFSTRTRKLRKELATAEARVLELELQLDAAVTTPVPTDADRVALHALLAERVHTGPVPVRKALFTALVDRLEVHDLDDVRPTFRLGGPDAANLATPDGQPAPQDAEQASQGSVFANHRSRWS